MRVLSLLQLCWGRRREAGRPSRRALVGESKTVIAVEFAHDCHYAVHRLKVGSRHRAVGDEQRLVEAAHLQRHELGGRFWRPAGEKAADVFAHAALRHALTSGNLGDGHAPVQEADDQRLSLGLLSPCRPSPRRRAVAAEGWGGFDGLGQGALS